MGERLTWKQIQTRYPDQWIGLADVVYVENDGISIESAIVKYSNMSHDELTQRMLRGEVVSRYTTPDNCGQLGFLG